tara:strand:- start:764 stop:1507 length:744 start_codon:yes stop_codon:yes gene_type:complete
LFINSLIKKNIIVIGSSRGLGKSISQSLVRNKANVINASRSNPSSDSNFIELDITNSESIASFIKYLKENNFLIDGIVIAAAKSLPPLLNMKEKRNNLQHPDVFNDLLKTNLCAIYNMIFNLELLLAPKSSIVFLSSIGAHRAFPDNIGYQVSKAAIESLARSLSYELASKEIRANSIALGYFKTDMTKKSYDNPKSRKERSERTILNRWGEPDEVCGTVNFLLSDASRYITGTTIHVDGGWSSKGL